MEPEQENNSPHVQPHVRPRGFSVQGHEEGEQLFLDAFNADRLHHAWLVTGTRGIGKASLCTKIARFMLHNPPEEAARAGLFGDALQRAAATSLTTEPESRVNRLITAESHGDLKLIQRSLNDKDKLREEIVIDDVEVLQNFFHKTSSEGGWRIAIIDSADEMNRNAANALLKILEEPPKNALLLLVAHAPGKLLPTIRSRCRQLKLKPLPQDKVQEILAGQYPELTVDEISGYATLSDGSPGHAISLMENQGLELYIELLELLASLPNLDVPLAHKMAGSLALKKDEKRYKLFGELLTSFINRMIRHVAALKQGDSPVQAALTGELDLMAQLGQRISLDQWAVLWEKIGHKLGQVNLDRKQVILNILTLLSQKLN